MRQKPTDLEAMRIRNRIWKKPRNSMDIAILFFGFPTPRSGLKAWHPAFGVGFQGVLICSPKALMVKTCNFGYKILHARLEDAFLVELDPC